MPRAYATNKIVQSPYYADILREYNRVLEEKGKVNKMKFFKEVVEPRVPNYGFRSWYSFLNKFETTAGLTAVNVVLTPQLPESISPQEEAALLAKLRDASSATRIGIAAALNVGADALADLIENPQLMTAKERAELLFKAMKAQDSRVSTIAAMKKDHREEVAFQKTFGNLAYVGATDDEIQEG